MAELPPGFTLERKASPLPDGFSLEQPQPAERIDRGFGRNAPGIIGFGRETVGLGEKALELGTAAIATPIAGLAGIVTGLAPGGKTAAEGVEGFMGGVDKIFGPRTLEGQRYTFVGDAMRWLEQKADLIGEVTGDPTDVLGATMVKTAILGAPALFGLRTALAPKPKLGAPVKPSGKLDLDAKGVIESAEKIVTRTFERFRTKVGDETPVAMTNTLEAAQKAVAELGKQGKLQSSIGRELKRIVGANVEEGTITAALLDDISSNMIRTIGNRRASGARQARAVLEGVIKDMDKAGKSVGMNFADDLATSRAFADLYKQRSRLGKVIGQHGKRLDAYRKVDPSGYREILTDWAGKKLETFVRTNAQGGRQFDTGGFAKWVTENESHLIRLVGPETVKVWKAFPKWEGRAGLIKGLGQRVLEAKSGGLSRLFNKEIDLRFAESIADVLTDPASPLFKALLSEKRPPALPLPSKLFEAGAVKAQLDKNNDLQSQIIAAGGFENLFRNNRK